MHRSKLYRNIALSAAVLLAAVLLASPLFLGGLFLTGGASKSAGGGSNEANGPSGLAQSSGGASWQEYPKVPVVESRPGGAKVSHDIHHDVSTRPLRDIVPVAINRSDSEKSIRNPEREPERKLPNAPHVPDTARQPGFGTGAPTIPTTTVNFEGIANNEDQIFPPDPTGDVGPNHYVQYVNLRYAIYSKTGTLMYGPAYASNTLFAGFGGACENRDDGDPIVQYDQLADRWILSQFAIPGYNPHLTGGFHQCVAISTSPDPMGTYYRYDFLISDTLFNDYPHFGVWPDGYYVAYNMYGIDPSTGDTPFVGPWVVALDRAQMLSGQQASLQYFQPATEDDYLLPSDLDGFRLPPAGAPNTTIGVDTTNVYGANSKLPVWDFHVDWNTPANSTFTHNTDISVSPYNLLCPNVSRQACISQPGTGQKLAGLGDRAMYRLSYRNRGTYQSWVVNHTVDVGFTAPLAGVRWYELQADIQAANSSPTLSLYQQSTYAPDANNRWNGSIAQNRFGDMALGYSVSSSTVYPSIYYTGRRLSDPINYMLQGEGVITTGTSSQLGGNRWGDYSTMSVDPVDDCTFWYTNEYYSGPPGQFGIDWRTRVGSFRFGSCTGSPVATSTPNTQASVTPQPSFTPTNTPTNSPTAIAQCVSTVYSGTIDFSTDPHQAGRLGRTTPSDCNGRFSPGVFNGDTNARAYDAYQFYNNTGQTQCITINLSAPSCTSSSTQPQSAAYLNFFNPNNLDENYLGDAGSPGTGSYQISVPPGSNFVVTVNVVAAGGSCGGYTLTVSCGVPGIGPTQTATSTATPTASATSVANCDINFSDVPASQTFYQYIKCLACRGVVSGFPDGTFRPGANITRGQIAKIVSNAAGFNFAVSGQTYTDVPPSNDPGSYYIYIERLTAKGVIGGYPCGVVGDPNSGPCDGESRAYFRPGNFATRGQLSKIVSNAAGFVNNVSGQTYADVPPGDPTHGSYYVYIERLTQRGVMSGYGCGAPGEPCPGQYFRPGNLVTRGQAAKIVSNTFFPNCQALPSATPVATGTPVPGGKTQ